MKKVFLGLMSISLILGLASGCSNNKEKELCNKIDEIDVQTYTSEENYEELTTILEDEYNIYCNEKNREVCEVLDKYIDATKEKIKIEDCSDKEGSWKEICESNNNLSILDKKNNVTYYHEEIWSICNN